MYVRTLPSMVTTRTASGSASSTHRCKITRTTKEVLVHKYPFLKDEDFVDEGLDGDEPSEIVVHVPAHIHDAIVVDFAAKLAELRAKWDHDGGEVDEHFLIRVELKKHGHGKNPYDRVGCHSRAHVADWCRVYKWPKEKTFGFDEHTDLGANLLAKEWARKGAFCFAIFVLFEDDEDFSYDALEHVYIESEEYLDWVHEQADVDTATFGCIITLREAFPCK